VKEKELRIALVCYGGVSLAVYMHGVTKELLKLVKASKEFHASADPVVRAGRSYADTAGSSADAVVDTEAIYFDLLQRISEKVELRVLLDVIAGSSAGGINGVLLARALAHDLPLDGLTELWLERADVTQLLEPDGRATSWSKWFLRPFLWTAFPRLKGLIPTEEMRDKLSMFVRSRWFKPPFDGLGLMRMLLEAARRMGRPRTSAASLLPVGQRLSLFVTVTDFHGYLQRIAAHDPPVVEEREHRHVFRFQYQHYAGEEVQSDFDEEGLPGLIFAARATSCFPGAFPPARLADLDRLLAGERLRWPGRERFIRRNLRRYAEQGGDPAEACFIDGSVLNNKPFAAAIREIADRPAYREVDRRLIYIDPDPQAGTGNGQSNGHAPRETPGFFRVIWGALSEIPRNEPVRDELIDIDRNNQLVRRLRSVLEEARPRIGGLIAEVVGGTIPDKVDAAQVHAWREAANARAAREAGFAYEAYVRLKIAGVLDTLVGRVQEAMGWAPETPEGEHAADLIWHWARSRGIWPERLSAGGLSHDQDAPPWVRFLLAFDGGFRTRRLRFVIRTLNQMYGQPGTVGNGTADHLDALKASFYAALDRLRHLGSTGAMEDDDWPLIAGAFGEKGDDGALDRALDRISSRIDLMHLNRGVDAIFAGLRPDEIGADTRRELFVAYVGFAFWDVLTFSISGWRDVEDLSEVKVDRISLRDAHLLMAMGGPTRLRGVNLNNFGGFFSRADREYDYLLGRLNAAERVIDLTLDAAGLLTTWPQADIDALKRRAFRTILDSEAARLGPSCIGVRELRALLDRAA
jgi:patatin-related protein